MSGRFHIFLTSSWQLANVPNAQSNGRYCDPKLQSKCWFSFYMSHRIKVHFTCHMLHVRNETFSYNLLRNGDFYSTKMFQIQHKICWEYLRNLRNCPPYGFSHVKIKKPIFDPKIPEFVGVIDHFEWYRWWFSKLILLNYKNSSQIVWE